jgi:hypothetical protein
MECTLRALCAKFLCASLWFNPASEIEILLLHTEIEFPVTL